MARCPVARFVFASFVFVAAARAPLARADGPAPAAPKPSPAAESAPPPATDFARPAPVTLILDELSKRTGVSIDWATDDKGVNTKKVVAGAALGGKPDRVFDAVRALLAQDEILLAPYGPTADRMYRAVDARALSSMFVARLQPEPIEVTDARLPLLVEQGGRFVTTTIRVTNLADLQAARSALQRLVTSNNIGSVSELPTARAFVVTDFAPNVAAIYRAVRQMDVPAPTPPAEPARVAPAYFPLKKARGAGVAVLLNQLFVAPASPAPSPSPSSGAPRAVGELAPRISYDEASNQIVVLATPADVATIREIVEHLDVDPSPR